MPGNPVSDSPARSSDDWLERWRERVGPPPRRVLDLGCGRGEDTRTLTGWHHQVVAIDRSPEALASAQRAVPDARFLQLDLRDLPGPLQQEFEIVIASLSLHYFDESETSRIFGAIRSLLPPGGLFVFRVNAYDDLNHGATGMHDGWELVEHRGTLKQFFTEAKIRSLVAGWAEIESLERRVTRRFGPPKSLFEVIAVKQANTRAHS